MRTLATLCVLCLSCATASPTTTTPNPAYRQSQVGLPPGNISCKGGPGHARLERLSPATVRLDPGTVVDLQWQISTKCAPIILHGVILHFRTGDGKEWSEAQRKPNRTVTADNMAVYTVSFDARPEMVGKSLAIDIDPVWMEAVTWQTFSWAERIGPTETVITVTQPVGAEL